MTCINAFVRPDRVHLVTDGAVYLPDGTMTGTMQKVHILAQAHAALAVRGPTYLAPALVAYLNSSSLAGFDDLRSKIPAATRFAIDHGLAGMNAEHVAEAAKLTDLKRADIVVAGWSHARMRGEVYRLDTSQEVWTLAPQAEGFMMPGTNPDLIQRLIAAGWRLDDERHDAMRLLELVRHQREVDDVRPDGARFRTVGGFVQHTIITAERVATGIMEEFPAPSAIPPSPLPI